MHWSRLLRVHASFPEVTITTASIESIVPKHHRDLVFRFFLTFSRFEYALKRAGFITASGTDIKPGWDKFSSKHRPAFNPSCSTELQQAEDYFSEHPPRK